MGTIRDAVDILLVSFSVVIVGVILMGATPRVTVLSNKNNLKVLGSKIGVFGEEDVMTVLEDKSRGVTCYGWASNSVSNPVNFSCVSTPEIRAAE